MAALACRWVWTLGRADDLPAQDIGHGLSLPPATATDRAPGWWGSVFLLTANATFFGSLLFGFAFLWTVAPGWPPPAWFTPSALEICISLAGAATGPIAIRWAIQAVRQEANAMPALAIAFAAAGAIGVACAAMKLRAPDPGGHAYGATLTVLSGYGLFHAGLVALMIAVLIAKVRGGLTSARRRSDFPVVGLWVDYLAVTGTLILLAGHLPGLLS